MTFGFCEFRHFVHECEGLREVLERIGPLNPTCVIADGPFRYLFVEDRNLLRTQRRDPAAARGAGLFNESGDRHELLPSVASATSTSISTLTAPTRLSLASCNGVGNGRK